MLSTKNLKLGHLRLTGYYALMLLVLTACTRPEPPSGLTEQDLAAIRALADQDSAIVMSRNWDKLAAEYTADAVRMPPNQPAIEGQTAIRNWFDQFPPVTAFSFKLVDLQGDGKMAFIRGAWTITFVTPGADTISDSGKILIVLEKQPDGTWLRVADAWNSDQ
ncbi:DUF4440 domain-containing protein [Oscillatoria amoena NRMC-F 0135]|nr:DUF4440 domain-containing protein [Oscillatoria amoena NRMC-F 0135]